MRIKKLFTTVISVLTLTAIILTGCGKDTGKDTSKDTSSTSTKLATVRLASVSNDISQWVGIIDDNTGIFNKHGIDLQITEFAAGIQGIDAVVTDQCDIAGGVADYGFINRVGNTSEKTDLEIISQVSGNSNLNLYVNPDKIKSGEDLKGANIVTIGGTVYDFWASKLLEYYGLKDDDANLLPVTSNSEALALLENGSADAWWVNPAEVEKYEEKGWKPLLNLSDINLSIYSLLVSSKSFVSENQDTVKKFYEALDEALEYAVNNLDEVADWNYDVTGTDRELFKTNYSNNDFGLSFTQEAFDDLEAVNEWCVENGNFTTEINVADYVDVDILTSIYPDKVTYKK